MPEQELTKMRILKMIEGITFSDFAMPDSEKISLIYKLAHIGSGSCQNQHTDWQQEAIKCEAALVEFGII